MSELSSPPDELFGQMVRLRRVSLLLFFGLGAALSLVGLLLEPRSAPDAQTGRRLFVLCAVLSGGMVLLAWRVPRLGPRLDPALLLAGTAAPLLAALGETLTFASQSSAMALLWPTVMTAGFLRRGLLGPQLALAAAALLALGWARSRWVQPLPIWWIDPLIVTVVVAATGAVVAFFRRVAEDEARELGRLVGTDHLTGLANRRGLHHGFAALLSGTRVPGGMVSGGLVSSGMVSGGRSGEARVALVLLDLDEFKQVNDRYGHQVGDEVLRRLAETLRGHAQPGDVLARLGGEEFVWITTAPGAPELLRRVEALRLAFADAEAARGLTVSAGVAHPPQLSGDEPLAALLHQADQALYQAKTAGRNRIQFSAHGAPGSLPVA